MKKYLRILEDEPIHKWIDRLAKALSLSPEQEEAMREVAKYSYIKGSNVATSILNKLNKR